MVQKDEIRKAVAEYKKKGKPKEHLVEVTFSELTDEQLAIVTFGIHKDLKRSMSSQDVAAALWNLKLLKDQVEEAEQELVSAVLEANPKMVMHLPTLKKNAMKQRMLKAMSKKKPVAQKKAAKKTVKRKKK